MCSEVVVTTIKARRKDILELGGKATVAGSNNWRANTLNTVSEKEEYAVCIRACGFLRYQSA
jgi:hypothetical protein